MSASTAVLITPFNITKYQRSLQASVAYNTECVSVVWLQAASLGGLSQHLSHSHSSQASPTCGWVGGVLIYSRLQLLQLAALTSRSSVCVHWPHVHCLLSQQGHSLTHSLTQSVCLIVGQHHKTAAERKRVDIDLNVKMQIHVLKEVDGNAKQKDIACKRGW